MYGHDIRQVDIHKITQGYALPYPYNISGLPFLHTHTHTNKSNYHYETIICTYSSLL